MPSIRAARLIDHLLARQQDPPILEKKTGLPYGWAIWLRSLSPLPRPLHAREVIEVLLPRPLPGPPGRSPQLGTWQAMRRLAWQQWGPAPRDQRWMRWSSAAASLLLHLLFAFLLLWVALVRTPDPDSEGADGERIQIEFIGQGAQEGGGDQPGGATTAVSQDNAGASAVASEDPAAASPDAQPAQAASAAATAAPPASTAAAEPSPPTEPAAYLPPPPAPPLQATEVAEPTRDFVVPPISVPRTEVSVLPRETTPTVREREISTVQAPVVRSSATATQVQIRSTPTAPMDVREREITIPEQVAVTAPAPVAVVQRPMDVRAPREPTVREREVATVTAPAMTAPQIRSREPALRLPDTSAPSVRERRVADAPATSASADTSASSSSTTAAGASPVAGDRASPTPAQAGARPAPTPGNWATPARGDDWGASSRTTEGAAQGTAASQDAGRGNGMFNADGSVRVPGQDGAGKSERGAPGGDNDGWTRDRIAQSGTWLKRPPYDYRPTSFDKYWVPHESLLAEWVRRGVQSIEIPLPGTTTKISCVISVLQFGGGCGLNDPNMQDQPAVARPPPDIPFKKELQEDNGSR